MTDKSGAVEKAGQPEPAPQHHPAAVPWLQGLGIIAALITGCLQAFVPEFDPPKELYYLFGAAIVGLDREYTVRIVNAIRGKG